jgi:hypothetical protein
VGIFVVGIFVVGIFAVGIFVVGIVVLGFFVVCCRYFKVSTIVKFGGLGFKIH